MGVTDIIESIRALPSGPRQELLERIEEEFSDDELSPELAAEIDRRAEAALAHPERCRPLADVIADLTKRT